ncbi:hypothetical protein [Haloplanus halophilus]|uniref:hypothetical protein n=1 Tax=Haloplanus halophilus TaxID=2949993 RepID=UPI00203B587B|nr:hypothetical protein [Haloplanus sp. GDY1]
MSTDGDGDGDAVVDPDGDGRVRRRGSGRPDDEPADLGWAGWVLIAAVVVAVLVIPAAVYLWPAGGSVLGAHYRTAMLVLPMIPAVVLGFVAVWSMKDRR